MKSWILILILVVVVAAGIGYYFWSKNSSSTPAVCAKTDTSFQMNFTEAKNIASGSACVKEGALKENHWCNQGTGTWWIDLDITKKGCSPACVIDVETKQAEINWMCTGLTQ